MITPTRIGKQYKPHNEMDWSLNTRYVYSANGELLAQYFSAEPQYINIIAGEETIGRYEPRSQQRVYYLNDHLGSVRVTVTEDGTIMNVCSLQHSINCKY
jgi:beta-glucosidase/6-phospho-beta-glucosidase/beta-galactosidase